MAGLFTNGHALIIGIADYSLISTLPNAVINDAIDVAALLQSNEHCRYPSANVRLLLDSQATAENIRSALIALAHTTTSADTVIIYFSGHGARNERNNDIITYIIPVDCDPKRLSDTAISSDQLTALLSCIKAGRLVVVLDACHSAGAGELKSIGLQSALKAGLDEQTYSLLAEGAGRVIMASSRSSEVSLILPGMANSVFTHYLLEGLKGASLNHGGEVVRVFDVFQHVSDNVAVRAPNQHPIFKAQNVENNFPLALYRGGKHTGPAGDLSESRPRTLSGPCKVLLARRLVDRWSELALYYDIASPEQAKFPKGEEPASILRWLEQRNRLDSLKDAFNFLAWDDLIEEIERCSTRSLVGAKSVNLDSPPPSPAPRQKSLEIDDIQKRRWGGKATGNGRRLYVSNIQHLKRKKHRYFQFDAILESTDGTAL